MSTDPRHEPPSHEEISRIAARHGLDPERVAEILASLDEAQARAREQGPQDPTLRLGLDIETVPLGQADDLEEAIGEGAGPPAPATPAMPSAFSSIDIPRLPPLREPAADRPLPEGAPVVEGGEQRYQDRGLLGEGGMGQVRRLLDRDLRRTVAIKTMRPELLDRPRSLARFIEEAQLVAQLEHPGILPIHELGRLGDGRYYFTMREVRGQTLSEVIERAHRRARRRGQPPQLGKLLEQLRRASEAVGHAHRLSVIHRDLKPHNIMVDDDGVVVVLDWGLAKIVGSPDELNPKEEDPAPEPSGVSTSRDQLGGFRTEYGEITGTPAYMAPEQALGELERLGPPTDVYALGCILFEILTGQRAWPEEHWPRLLMRKIQGAFTPIEEVASCAPPAPLVRLCQRAMALDPDDRPASAVEFTAELGAWIEGQWRRERADELTGHAAELRAQLEEMGHRADRLVERAQARLEVIPSHAPEAAKAEAWALEDEGLELRERAEVRRAELEFALREALSHDPEHTRARAFLARHYLAEVTQAEARADRRQRVRAELNLREHLSKLPEGDPTRQDAQRYLANTGELTLTFEPASASVTLRRYASRQRRLVADEAQELEAGSIQGLELPAGSYLLELRAPEHHPARYPVHIERGQTWSTTPPGAQGPRPVRLLPQGQLGPEDLFVPAGWCVTGGGEGRTLPRRRVWIPDFVLQRHPISNADYIAFLDDLVAQGRQGEALAHVPRDTAGADRDPVPIYGRRGDGGFELVPDPDGDLWEPDWPVVMINLQDAVAYCRWRRQRDGLPWRLPREMEWEKAARGVDGRLLPWGDHPDPCRANNLRSLPDHPTLVGRGAFPLDVSPYGVRHLAGNIQDMCHEVYRRDLDPVTALAPTDAIAEAPDEPEAPRVERGSSWAHESSAKALTERTYASAKNLLYSRSFRLARSIEPDQ